MSGAIIRAWGGSDLRLRVLEREEVAEDFLRLRVDLNGPLDRDEVYLTYWLRLWFTCPSGKGHQRAYTVVAPAATRSHTSPPTCSWTATAPPIPRSPTRCAARTSCP